MDKKNPKPTLITKQNNDVTEKLLQWIGSRSRYCCKFLKTIKGVKDEKIKKRGSKYETQILYVGQEARRESNCPASEPIRTAQAATVGKCKKKRQQPPFGDSDIQFHSHGNMSVPWLQKWSFRVRSQRRADLISLYVYGLLWLWKTF